MVHLAAKHNSIKVLKLLIECEYKMDCVPIDQPDPYYGSTPLAWASKYDSSHDAVRYLVEKGAFVNNKGQDGNTPLIWACDNKATKNADYLIKNCANTTLPNLNGDTPLSIVQKSLNSTLLIEPSWSPEKGLSDLARHLQDPTYIDKVQSHCRFLKTKNTIN